MEKVLQMFVRLNGCPERRDCVSFVVTSPLCRILLLYSVHIWLYLYTYSLYSAALILRLLLPSLHDAVMFCTAVRRTIYPWSCTSLKGINVQTVQLRLVPNNAALLLAGKLNFFQSIFVELQHDQLVRTSQAFAFHTALYNARNSTQLKQLMLLNTTNASHTNS